MLSTCGLSANHWILLDGLAIWILSAVGANRSALNDIHFHGLKVIREEAQALDILSAHFSVIEKLELGHFIDRLHFVLLCFVLFNSAHGGLSVFAKVGLDLKRLQFIMLLDLLSVHYVVNVALQFRSTDGVLKDCANCFPLVVNH